MANILAAQSGNWSDPLTWVGGTLPGADDIAHTNSFVVTIDQDISCVALTNSAINGSLVGGGFVVSAVVTERTITILGPTFGGSYVGPTSPALLTCQHSSGTVIVIANTVGPSRGDVYGTVRITSTGNYVNIGNVSSGTAGGSWAYGLNISGNGNVTVNGDVSGNTTATAWGVGIVFSGLGILTINGTVTSGVGTVPPYPSPGVYMTSAGTLIVKGDCITQHISQGIWSTHGSAIIDIFGTVIASSVAYGLQAAGLSNRVRTLVDAPNGRKAVYAPGWIVPQTGPISATVYRDDAAFVPNATQTVTSFVSDSPPPADVRAGILYGPGHDLVGAMTVPPPESVQANIAVDNTTGQATLSPTEVWEHEIAAGVLAKNRLMVNATIESTGAQIAAATGG